MLKSDWQWQRKRRDRCRGSRHGVREGAVRRRTGQGRRRVPRRAVSETPERARALGVNDEELMEAWAEYCGTIEAKSTKVIALGGRGQKLT